MHVKSFRDLMAGHTSAEISCLYTKQVVRKLRVVGDEWVEIDACMAGQPPINVSIYTLIEHEPWVMDRGNMLFKSEAVEPQSALPEMLRGKKLKICGEEDRIVYEDGTTTTVNPE